MTMLGDISHYPWLAPAWQRYTQFKERVPHALLIDGVDGIGKQILAFAIAYDLLNRDSNPADAKQQLKGCHPDLHLITTELNASEFVSSATDAGSTFEQYALRYLADDYTTASRKPRRVIAVDQIRSLIEAFSQAAHSALHKVAVISPAEAMNVNASNALLKLLEEPPAGGFLILSCQDTQRLPATILSRCVRLNVRVPSIAEGLEWITQYQPELADETHSAARLLALANGAPLAAINMAKHDLLAQDQLLCEGLSELMCRKSDAIVLADRLKALDIVWLMGRCQQLLLAALRAMYSIGGDEASKLSPSEAYSQWLTAAKSLDASALIKAYDAIVALRRGDIEQLNAQLVLERLFIGLAARAR